MKKTYEKPYVEKIEFDYNEQVVAASTCISKWVNQGTNGSCEGEQKYSSINN